jgi:hypothetical protein
MAERKVLQKYYPPDFDPSSITRVKGPKRTGPKVQTVRLMAPFSMKCTSCGEFIYRGRKFNARKETSDEKYYSITIYRFYIRCTRCSGEITFKTDPKNMDYECEKGAKRNFEPWREKGNGKQETDEERLDRLEQEEAERDAMGELEEKVADAKTEMAVADALDMIRSRNARNAKVEKDGAVEAVTVKDDGAAERQRQEKEDEEAAKKAFRTDKGEKTKRRNRGASHASYKYQSRREPAAATFLQERSQAKEGLFVGARHQEEACPRLESVKEQLSVDTFGPSQRRIQQQRPIAKVERSFVVGQQSGWKLWKERVLQRSMAHWCIGQNTSQITGGFTKLWPLSKYHVEEYGGAVSSQTHSRFLP